MITDSDNRIIESTIDNLPISKEILIEHGWKFISSSRLYAGSDNFIYYHIYEREPSVYIHLYENGNAFLIVNNMYYLRPQSRLVRTMSEVNKKLGELMQIKY